MGRAPCCDKVGLKKGPWTPEEDEILISFVQKHGHSNWRALPKQAGLLRCGKSCRLRWINYLRPDIKRGNFSREEEETIIQLHEMMGNRWSAIAARLPGRTDNEIKNVWHTHLKKRLKQYQQSTNSRFKNGKKNCDIKNVTTPTTVSTTTTTESTSSEYNLENSDQIATSPQQSYTISEDFSSEALSVEFSNDTNITMEDITPIIDETFWESQELPLDDIHYNKDIPECSTMFFDDHQFEFQNNFSPIFYNEKDGPKYYDEDNMDFWLDVFVQAGGTQQLPEF